MARGLMALTMAVAFYGHGLRFASLRRMRFSRLVEALEQTAKATGTGSRKLKVQHLRRTETFTAFHRAKRA